MTAGIKLEEDGRSKLFGVVVGFGGVDGGRGRGRDRGSGAGDGDDDDVFAA